jgi:hypothetical protein
VNFSGAFFGHARPWANTTEGHFVILRKVLTQTKALCTKTFARNHGDIGSHAVEQVMGQIKAAVDDNTAFQAPEK